MGFPVIPTAGDLTNPAPIILYTPEYGSDTSLGPQSWTSDIVFPSQFRLIHEVKIIQSASIDGLDIVIVAGREGTVVLWFERGKWRYNVINKGGPEEPGNPYWGSGSVDVGAVGDDPIGYIVTCEVRLADTSNVLIVHRYSNYDRLSMGILWLCT
jgi:hypothetical protein